MSIKIIPAIDLGCMSSTWPPRETVMKPIPVRCCNSWMLLSRAYKQAAGYATRPMSVPAWTVARPAW
jgi:hypothetical protein